MYRNGEEESTWVPGHKQQSCGAAAFGTSQVSPQVLIRVVRAISDPSDEKIQEAQSNSCGSFVCGETKAATLISE